MNDAIAIYILISLVGMFMYTIHRVTEPVRYNIYIGDVVVWIVCLPVTLVVLLTIGITKLCEIEIFKG